LEFICILVLVFWYLALFIEVKRIVVVATPHVKIDIDLAM